MAAHPPIIGLVGGIGAGKSTVASVLRELGCLVSDSDELARASFRDPAVIRRLQERWGSGILAAEGSIDRRAVAGIVFADAAERCFLESIVHPWIERRRAAQFAAAPPGTPALVIDAPLLLEAGLGPQCDAVLFVDAPRPVRLARVMAARGWDDAELARREAAQWPLDRKRAASSQVIENDGDLAGLREQLGRVLEGLRRSG